MKINIDPKLYGATIISVILTLFANYGISKMIQGSGSGMGLLVYGSITGVLIALIVSIIFTITFSEKSNNSNKDYLNLMEK